MKIINIILIILVIIKIVKCQINGGLVIKWTNTTDGMNFEDKDGWENKIVPGRNDSVIIGIPDITVFAETSEYIFMDSLSIESGSILVSKNTSVLYSYKNITIDDESIIKYFTIGSPLIEVRGQLLSLPSSSLEFTSIMLSNLNFYNNAIFGSNNPNCTQETCNNFQEGSTFTFFDKSSLIQVNSYCMFDNFIFNNESFANLNGSNLYIKSPMTLNDDSIFNVNGGTLFTVDNEIILNGKSKLVLDESRVISSKPFLMYDESSLVCKRNSFIFIDGQCRINNAEIKEYSSFEAFGKVITSGDYFNFKESSSLIITGSLIFNSSESIVNTSLINVMGSGDVSIFNKLLSINSNIKIDGNFVCNSNSDIEMVNSRILLLKGGKLLISSTSKLILNGTEVENENGVLTTIGDIKLSSLSNIINRNEFYLSSNIYETSHTSSIKNSGIIYINSNNQDDNNKLELGIEFINSGIINIGSNGDFYKYSQSENSTFIINNNVTLSSNQTFSIDGGIVTGNGTFNSSINHNSGLVGSFNQTNQINITNNYNQNEDATIVILINSLDDFSKINIEKYANLNGAIEIKINSKLLKENNKQFSIINFNNNENDNLKSNILNSVGSTSSSSSNINFKSIKFGTYDPDTGNEEIIENSECVQSKTTEKSFSLLVGGCESNSLTKSLAKGAIAGIIIGCAAFVVIASVLFHYRSRILLKARHSKILLKTRK